MPKFNNDLSITKKSFDSFLKTSDDLANNFAEIKSSMSATNTIAKTTWNSLKNVSWWWTTDTTKKSWWKSQAQKDTEALQKQAEKDAEAEIERQKKLAEYIKQQEEEKQKKYEETYKTVKDVYWKVSDVLEDNINDSKKNIEIFEDKIKDLKDSIKDLNKDLASLSEEKWAELGARNVAILERQAELQDQLNELKREWVDLSLAQSIWETSLKSIWSWTIWSSDVKDLLKVVEIQKELNSLIEEKRLIEANATKEELAEWKRIAELSPTAKLLEETKKKKEQLQEQFLIKQWLSEQEIQDEIKKQWTIDEVVKNFQANQLKNLENQKTIEQWILEWFTNYKIWLDERYKNASTEIEKSITDTLVTETEKRGLALDKLKQKAIETANALRTAWVSIAWTCETWSTSTQNNSTTVWNIVINSNQDPKIIAQEVQKAITNASKNAGKWIY